MTNYVFALHRNADWGFGDSCLTVPQSESMTAKAS